MTVLEVAIVGSGPGGFFAAEALFKSGIELCVHMFDRLPTPFGLVRSGVAPDHQHIKQVVRVFEGVAKNPMFSFFGNVEIDKDLSLKALELRYDAVILAYGASEGVPLDIPGGELEQSLTATEFVGWYNGHPNYANLAPDLDHETAVIVGHGNVAIDVARILLSNHERLAKTDIADHALEVLRESKIRRVHLVGRRGPAQASFTTAELRELVLGLPDVQVKINPQALNLLPEDSARVEQPVNAIIQRNLRVLEEAALRSKQAGSGRELHLTFLASPTALRGSGRVHAIDFVKNELVGPADSRRATPTSQTFSVGAGLVISSIGFRGRPLACVPFDRKRGIIPNSAGRVIGAASDGSAALYVTGWIKRGPSGVIGTNRADAVETVQTLLADFHAGLLPLKVGLRQNLAVPARPIDFAGWARIDDAERRAGAESGRPRKKIVDLDRMLEVASCDPEVGAAAGDPAWHRDCDPHLQASLRRYLPDS
jgi:ferredoxin--NADP+ reductase